MIHECKENFKIVFFFSFLSIENIVVPLPLSDFPLKLICCIPSYHFEFSVFALLHYVFSTCNKYISFEEQHVYLSF